MSPDSAARRYRIIINDALDLVARGLRDAVAPRMARYLGPEWWTQLPSTKDNSDFARLDVTSYARVLEFGPYRAEMRGCFRVDYRSWGPVIRRIRDYRHEFHGHPDRDPTGDEALLVVTDCLLLAERLQLNCATALAELVRQAQEVSGGKRLVEIDAEDLAAHQEMASRLADEHARASQLEVRAAAASAAADDALAELQQRRTSDEAALRDKDQRIMELQGRLQALDEGSKAAAQLAGQLEVAQRERLDLARDRDQTRTALDTARREQRKAAAAEREAVDELARARAEVATLQSELVRARVAREERTAQPGLEGQRLLHLVLERLERQSSAPVSGQELQQPEAEDATLPEPGNPWPYERGAEEWTLSLAAHAMTRLGDGITLAELVGKVSADSLIQRFFRIRPRGGRIWVDEGGDACTFVEGELVYLGRLPTHPTTAPPLVTARPFDGDAPAEQELVEPGDPWPGPLGTFSAAFDLAQADIVTELREPASLRSLIGPDRAARLFIRLGGALVRRNGRGPSTGRFRVDRHGRAVTEEGRRFLGMIRADEWWQAHIDFGVEHVPLPHLMSPLPVISPPDFQVRTIRALADHHWGRETGPMPRGRRFTESGWEFSGYRMVGCPRCRRALAHFEKQRTVDTLWHAYYCPSCPEIYAGSELEDTSLIHWPHDYRCEQPRPPVTDRRPSKRATQAQVESFRLRQAATEAVATGRALLAGMQQAPTSSSSDTPTAVARQRQPQPRAQDLGIYESAAALRNAHPAASTPVGSTAMVKSKKLGRTFLYTVKVNASMKERYWGGTEL